jgi:hypothetical protein
MVCQLCASKIIRPRLGHLSYCIMKHTAETVERVVKAVMVRPTGEPHESWPARIFLRDYRARRSSVTGIRYGTYSAKASAT